MKTFYKGLLAVTALVAVSSAIPVMSTVLNGDRLVKAERLQTAETINRPQKATARAQAQGIPYWQTAKSIYNAKGESDKENGVVREFGTHIEIDGETARIYGLVNVNYSGGFEIDREFAVEGVYNERYGTITVSGTNYDPERPLSEYNRLADIYSPYDEMSYAVILIAGDCDERGDITTTEELVFDVSDDMSTIRAKKGFGAYAFTPEGEPKAFVDFYQTSKIEKAPEKTILKTNTDNLAFKGLFVAAGMPVVERFNLMNTGAVEGAFKVTTSSPMLKVVPSEGTVGGCATMPLAVTFSPEEAGMFNGKITIESATQTVEVNVSTQVRETPDYTKIVKAESQPIKFEMSPVYPFVISTVDGNTVAESINNGEGDGTESWFRCIVDVPAGQTGMFSWKAIQECQQPNTLAIFLDGEVAKQEMYRPNTEPYDMSGAFALTQGKHEIVFVNVITMDWSIYGKFQRSYVWDLNFNLMEAKDDNAALVDDRADFGETYFDRLSVRMDSEVTVLNTGKNPLKVLSVTADGNFNGSVPDISVPAGGEIKVPLVWNAVAVGEDKGTVTIRTTGGDLAVDCSGKALALPYDYSTIVSEGEFSFNTGRDWPFKPNEKGTFAYNTTSRTDINGITYSWLEASFEVPEGKVGHLSWDAKNESEDIFVFMNTPSLISGSIFTIDGGNEKMVGGLETPCTSSDLYKPTELTFRPGRHTVKFNYKKTDNADKFVFGKDMLQLFDIALRLNDAGEEEGSMSTSVFEYPNEVLVGTTGHMYANLINFTTKKPEIIASECDGPFKAVSVGEQDGNLDVMIEFTPEKEGIYAADLILKTNIGSYTVKCSGKAVDSGLGQPVFYESFEYGIGENWIMVDNGGEGNFWKQVKKVPEIFSNKGMCPYDGNGFLYVSYMDPETMTYYNKVDAYAVTPAISIPADGKTTLRFMVDGKGFPTEILDISAGEGDDPSGYTKVGSVEISQSGWMTQTFDLSQFAGKEIHIAFHMGDDIGMYVSIDDVLVASTGVNAVESVGAESIISKEYYTPDGIRHEGPVEGVNIVVIRKSDGTVSSRKEWIR